MNLDFLNAPRFWAMVLGALVLYLETKGWIGEAERNLILTLSGGFIGVGTIDRTVDKLAARK